MKAGVSNCSFLCSEETLGQNLYNPSIFSLKRQLRDPIQAGVNLILGYQSHSWANIELQWEHAGPGVSLTFSLGGIKGYWM